MDIYGTFGNDVLTGTANADYIDGGEGDDRADGGAGNDEIRGGNGRDTLNGDDGDDYVVGQDGDDFVFGGRGNDILGGDAGDDHVEGGEGNDSIYGSEGNDYLIGQDGFDAVYGGLGNDILGGDAGDDHVEGGDGNDMIYGGTGNDYLVGQDGFDGLYGGAGNDIMGGDAGDDRLEGGEGDDVLYGGAGDDYVVGQAGQDRIFGGDGNDVLGGDDNEDRIEGGAGDDVIYGGESNDFLIGEAGQDRVFGGAGNDILGGDAGDDRVEGGDGDDYVYGSEGNDYLIGEAGNDGVYGGAGNDILGGDAGNDRVEGGDGDDIIYGSEGEDFLIGELGQDTLYGGIGNDIMGGDTGDDRLEGGEGDDVLYGGDGADFVIGQAGQDTIFGGAGNDILGGDAGDDRVEGGDGDDAIYGSEGADFLIGQAGNDFVNGGAGNDILGGDAGDDRVEGGDGDDVIYGSEGADFLIGEAGNDRVYGGIGNDVLGGDAGDDRVEGGDGDDAIYGSEGADVLLGDAGADVLNGGVGNDRLIGGTGADRLTGGEGADSFFIENTSGSSFQIDTIVDFDAPLDTIELAGGFDQIFSSLAFGTLGAQAFRIGSAAVDADDRIIYDSTTGAVMLDIDGVGGTGAIVFAQIATGLALTAADFNVVPNATSVARGNSVPTITSPATASVAENSPTSTVVYRATATDADGDSINFSLGGPNADRFSIDGATGEVRFLTSPDFEAQSTFNFTVNAYDSSGVASTRVVNLSVTDVADTPVPPPPPTGTAGPTPVFTDREANDTSGSAQFIERSALRIDASNPNLPSNTLPSGSIQGTIGTPTDRDFFSIFLNEGEQLTLDIDGSTGGLDALVRYYSPAGTQLGFNDDASVLDRGSSTMLDSFARFRAPTSGTYTFSVESYPPGAGDTTVRSQGAYTLNFSLGPPANAAQIQEEDIQALLTGRSWGGPNTSISYSFPDVSTDYADYPSDGGDQEQTTFRQLTLAQRNATNDVVGRVLSFSEIRIIGNFGADGDADLRYGRTEVGETAHAYLPRVTGSLTTTGREGDVWFRVGTYDNPVVGNYSWVTIAHETGHALGLGHGHEGLSYAHDSMEYSIMTYRAYVGAALTGYTNESFGFAQSYMMYDIAALQRLYGADFSTNSGDSVYSWNPQTGQMTIGGTAAVTPGANRVFLTVWDGGGNDTYDLSNYSTNTVIDLRPGEFSTTSQVQLANLGNGNYARGNVANALLYEGDTRSLIENAVAGPGNDALIANQVANRLTGGAGADTFRWMSASDGAVGAADTILDFQSGTDRIDLSRIDADSRTVGDDAFRFIGSAAFTGSAGELRFDAGPGGAHLFGDVNGDRVADFEIILQNTAPPVATDFSF